MTLVRRLWQAEASAVWQQRADASLFFRLAVVFETMQTVLTSSVNPWTGRFVDKVSGA